MGEKRWEDYFKNEIKIGDLVLYPNRQGSSMWMNHGTVLARGSSYGKPTIIVKKVQTNYKGQFMGHREVTVYVLDRVIALGRGYGDFGFRPTKAPTSLESTWLDRLMNFFRGNPKNPEMSWLR